MRLIIIALLALLALSACDTETTTDAPDLPDTPDEQPTPVETSTFCGDGDIQRPNDDGVMEACDNGARNGQGCSAPYGGSCLACTDSCEQERVEGGYCGNGVCEDYEDYDICADDCERVFETPQGEDGLLYAYPDGDFDGEGEYVEDDVDLDGTFSMALWVLRNDAKTAYLVSHSDVGPMPRGGYSLSVDKVGLVRYETHDFTEATSKRGEVPVGEWTHVAVTFDADRIPQLIFFVDGEVSREQNSVTPPSDIDAGLLIGRRGPEPTFGLNGSIRDLRIYERTLTADEIGVLSDAQP